MELLKQANGNIPRTPEQKEQMIENAAKHYGAFLLALGFDYLSDENSKDTPRRVAKAWIEDIISGTLKPKPKISHFPAGAYNGIVFDGDIDVVSLCSHHNLPFIGKAHVAYIPKQGEKVVGLSKLNRIIDWLARRPQIQEGLTLQIHDELDKMIGNEGIAVFVNCKHLCCSSRGIKHQSSMQTAQFSGHFFSNEKGTKDEFYQMVANLK
jgi:GTP cyclohydrolase I